MSQPPPPMPVQPLDYGHPLGPQRPGVVLAVAIMSLIMSLLSGFYAIQTGLSAILFAAMPAFTATMTPAAPGTLANPAGKPNAAALPTPVAKQLADAIAQRYALATERRANLVRLLEEHGGSILQSLSPSDLTSQITESGKAGQNDYLLTGLGRIEISDEGASFQPTGAVVVKRVGGLEPAQATAIAQITAARNRGLLDAQGEITLTAHLSTPGQTLIDLSGDAPPPLSQQLRVVRESSGNTTIFTDRGYVTLQPNGSVLVSALGAPPTSAQAAAAPPIPFPLFPRVGSAQTIAMVISSAVSLLLAGYLLFASIMVFRNAPSGRKHHLRWVWVKVPVVLVGAGIYGWWMGTFVTGMIGSLPGQAPGVPAAMFYWLYAVFDGFLGLIYPIVIGILMNLRAVREYYLGLGR